MKLKLYPIPWEILHAYSYDPSCLHGMWLELIRGRATRPEDIDMYCDWIMQCCYNG